MAPNIPRKEIGFKYTNSLAALAEKYKWLAHPDTVRWIMQMVTAECDKQLVILLRNEPEHPKDTTLMQNRWQIPISYLKTHSGDVWEIYAENTATVGERQQILERRFTGTHRKKKRTGKHNLKRYAKWVLKTQSKFYTKNLRIIHQKLPGIFKDILMQKVSFVAVQRGMFTSEQEYQFGKDVREVF